MRQGATSLALTAAVAALVAVAGCSGSGGSDDGGKDGSAKTGDGVSITVKPGAKGAPVPLGQKVSVKADGGEIAALEASAPEFGDLAGSVSQDKHTWTSSTAVAPGAKYTVRVRVTDEDGKQVTKDTTFTTEKAKETFVGEYHPDKGTTVGVGMPVSIVFNKPVQDKAAVERKLKVTASPAVDGAWSWMKDRDGRDRIDYRPQEFWKAGTKVTLRMNLAGVDAGGGVYGIQNRVVNFQIGKAVTTTVDTRKKQLTVKEDGRTAATLPVSSGKPGFETWNGTMVVLGKVPSITMNSRTVKIFGPEAYDLKGVKWDVQLTPSGTYTHAAPWNEGKFGRVNGSHGCIGMSTSNAKRFYDLVGVGDPVTVIHSKDTVDTNNGYGDWNVDWSTWKAGSALS